MKSIIACLAALLLAMPSGLAQNLTSRFDSGDEGWHPGNNSSISWKEKGGNPGGFLLGEDRGNGSVWYYVSPRSWSGKWTSYIGGNLSFDIRLIDPDGGSNLRFDDILIIFGPNGSKLSWPGSIIPWPGEPSSKWTHYALFLLPSTFGLNESEFKKFMGNVSELWIRGGFSDKARLEGLDNVNVEAAPKPHGKAEHGDGHKSESIDLEFYRKSSNIESGYAERGGSGEGKSISNIKDKTISFYCEDTAWGTHWVSGVLWDEFVYDKKDHSNRIILNCDIKGEMALVAPPIQIDNGIFGSILSLAIPAEGETNFQVYLILHDKTDGIDIEKKCIYSKSSDKSAYLNEVIKKSVTDYVDAQLITNHIYQVKLKADASSSAKGLSGVIIDCDISWGYAEVKWV